MKYKPPVCDCGARLVYWEEEMYEITTPITQEGILSKRSIKKTATGVPGAWERLHCSKCFNEYEVLKDDEGRIKRGDSWAVASNR